MTVRQGADDVEGVPEAGHRGAPLEQDAQSLDESGRPAGEVGEGALLDLAALAIGLAEQDGGRGGAVGHGFDVHGYIMQPMKPETLLQINCLARMSAGNQGNFSLGGRVLLVWVRLRSC